jgi:hypothetical protein
MCPFLVRPARAGLVFNCHDLARFNGMESPIIICARMCGSSWGFHYGISKLKLQKKVK